LLLFVCLLWKSKVVEGQRVEGEQAREEQRLGAAQRAHTLDVVAFEQQLGGAGINTICAFSG
jgi:hypothetical protein